MVKVKAIIYRELRESPIKVDYNDICFHFSSCFNKNRFNSKIENYCKEEKLKLQNKYHVEIESDDLFAIAFYKKIEHRGFYITNEDGELKDKVKIKVGD